MTKDTLLNHLDDYEQHLGKELEDLVDEARHLNGIISRLKYCDESEYPKLKEEALKLIREHLAKNFKNIASKAAYTIKL